MIIVTHGHVVSCPEAAKARNIKLKQELKTLLLRIDTKNIAAHIRACDTLSSKEIKNLFKSKHLRFLTNEELAIFNISCGVINPWNIDFCQYHLLCKNVFKNKYLATNNSKFDEGIIFNSYRLLNLPNSIIGNFSNENKKYL